MMYGHVQLYARVHDEAQSNPMEARKRAKSRPTLFHFRRSFRERAYLCKCYTTRAPAAVEPFRYVYRLFQN